MNFNDELEKLKKFQEQSMEECESLDYLTQEELRLVTHKIEEKYLEQSKKTLTKVKENNEAYDNFCKLIASYSIFDDIVIGRVLADLISIFEGVPFVYQEADYNSSQVKHFTFDCEEMRAQHRLKIIIAEECKAYSYSDDIKNPKLLAKNGKALILADEAHGWKSNIKFYYANTYEHSLKQLVNFENFSYVKDFIDYLISYKIENKVTKISHDCLSQLEREFISSRVEQIEKNYRIMEKEKEEQIRMQLKKEFEDCQLRLKRILG